MQCALINHHMLIAPRSVTVCCNHSQHWSITPDQYWSGTIRTELATQLAQGQWPTHCQQCRDQESQGQQSLRQWSNHQFGHRTPLDHQPRYVDLRLSNSCNLTCRMCDPRYSAGIASEMHRHDLKEYYPTPSQSHKLQQIQDDDLDQIRAWLPLIDRMQFTGGEPTQIPQVKEIIETSIQSGHARTCDLLITTNATHTDAWWLALADHFRSVHITVSMDGVGETFEYIRHGADWSRFSANVHEIIRAVSSVQINSVMSAYTIPTLTDQCRTVRQWQLMHRSLWPRGHFAWTMPVIHEPSQLRCWVYPRMYRRVLVNEIRNAVSMCDQWLMTAVAESGRSVITQFESQPESPQLWDKFARYTRALDKIRHSQHTLSWHHMFD